jgi:predicted nucleotidyltransferase
MFGLTAQEWKMLDALAVQRLKSSGAAVWIFGSRSRGDHKRYSDVDLLYAASQPLPQGLIFEVVSELEESDLPYKVDLVNLNDLADSYRDAVLRDRREL